MIVVTTPTGSIGSKVLAGLLAETTEPLRVIARDPKRLPFDLPEHVEVVQGQTNDPDTLRAALQGASALFWCQPDTPTAEDYLQAYNDWSIIACDAIRSCGISHVVAISGAGEKPPVPAGPASGLHLMEEVFSLSNASLRFLRCGSFYSNLFWNWEQIVDEGLFSSGMPGDVVAPHLSVEDISNVAVGLLIDRKWEGNQALQLLGPQNISFNYMAAELTRHLGKTVRYEQIPNEQYFESCVQSGMSKSAAQGLIDIANYLENYYVTAQNIDRSITPTTFPNWLAENIPVNS